MNENDNETFMGEPGSNEAFMEEPGNNEVFMEDPSSHFLVTNTPPVFDRWARKETQLRKL